MKRAPINPTIGVAAEYVRDVIGADDKEVLRQQYADLARMKDILQAAATGPLRKLPEALLRFKDDLEERRLGRVS